MTSQVQTYETRHLGSATVTTVNEAEGYLRVRLMIEGQVQETWARMATAFSHRWSAGDQALVVGDGAEDLYAIGVLRSPAGSSAQATSLPLADGARAVVETSPDQPALRVYSKSNELVLEYEPEGNKTRVAVESGTLEFVTKNGDIAFTSAGSIRMTAAQTIDLASRWGTRLTVVDVLGHLRSAVTLGIKKLKFSSRHLAVDARSGDLQIDDTRWTAKRIEGSAGYVKLTVDKIETIAQTVVQRVKNAYRWVEQLAQLKAGRVRTLVDSTYHMTSRKAFLRAKEDFKVNADKIHLG